MADQHQDLPLVVSEILIEMHELRSDIKGLKGEMSDVKTAIVQLTGSVTSLAGSMKTMMEENRSNTEMLIAAFREEGLHSRRLFELHDARITQLENKQPNK